MRTIAFIAVLICTPPPASAAIRGEIVERGGIARRATVLEQGIPVAPMPLDRARALAVLDARGTPLPGAVEPEAQDENGMVRWLRVTAVVSLPAKGRLPVRIEPGRIRVPEFAVRRLDGGVEVRTAHYRLAARDPGEIELSSGRAGLLAGRWSVELIGDARSILWRAYFREFVPAGVEVEESTKTRATLLLKGSVPVSGDRRIDCELRLFVNAFSPRIRFAWRITNQLRQKVWLQRYALRLPLAAPASAAPNTRGAVKLLSVGAARLAVTADFLDDLGRGAGMALAAGGRALLHGGLNMPPDGDPLSGPPPDVHRMFHKGMSRTFSGALIPNGTASDAADALAPVDFVLPPQYYSDVGALPEAGDPVTPGEYAPHVRRAAEWLLKNQWRGTLYWGEWYRERDDTRNQAVQEASNGHSPLAPLYHYWRTGDARFLRAARRSAEYVWDVQLTRSDEHVGWMFHTRRHLFDELDWIHPRYQRATGGLVASHVFLNAPARRDIIAAIRNFHTRCFDERGIPHAWNKAANRRGDTEDGVDTSNFMEALTWCYRETGDRYFLDAALKMSRWTASRWALRGKRKGDDWNWNLSQYALRGLYTLWECSRDREVFDVMAGIVRKTLDNTARSGYELRDGVGGGETHAVFYHAWVATRIAKLCPDGDELVRKLAEVVRREAARQRPDGLISLDHGHESGLKTVWTSYYDAKALVAYVPVLTAHLASKKDR